MKNARIVGLITARGGSKGVPRKNIRPLGGKPLIAWTIEAGLGASSLSRLIVSTEDPEIARVCRESGAEVPFTRPAELSQDNSPHVDVVVHALDWLNAHGDSPDYLMLLQPTSPFRTSGDIDAAALIARQHSPSAVLSVHEMHMHPYFTRAIAGSGLLVPFMPMQELKYPRRQDLPPAYYVNGAIYINRAASLRSERSFYPDDCRPYIMSEERSLQIDNTLDFRIAEAVLAGCSEPPTE